MTTPFLIGDWPIAPDSPAYVIAEIGMNHNGDYDLAVRQIEAAARTGCQAVKFQTFQTEEFLVRSDERFDAMKKHELQESAYPKLKAISESMGLQFFSSAFDEGSVDFLDALDVPCFKIASCDLNNLPLLEHVASKGRPILVSTGYSTIEEIDVTVGLLQERGAAFVLLHCIASYPTAINEANLRTLGTFKERFGCLVGLSDHSLSQDLVPTAARAYGACVFEKHFTLDKSLDGFDHGMSANVDDMTTMVQVIRQTESALGVARQDAFQVELQKIERARRGLYWRRDLSPGEVVGPDDIQILRPRAALAPGDFGELIGCTIKVGVTAQQPITHDDVHPLIAY